MTGSRVALGDGRRLWHRAAIVQHFARKGESVVIADPRQGARCCAGVFYQGHRWSGFIC